VTEVTSVVAEGAPVLPRQRGASHVPSDSGPGRPPVSPGWLVAGLVVLCVLVRFRPGGVGALLASPAVATWATLCVAVSVQALPFLVLGVAVSTVVTTFLPDDLLSRALPRRQVLAVPAAGLAGALLPGCECGSVPVARGLMSRGVGQAAALTFMLAAPAVNPIVLVSTAVAFPGSPGMVAARFLASLVTAVVVGLLWTRFGREDWLLARALPRRHDHDSRLGHARTVAVHDFLHSGGYLVVGAAASATLHVVVPRELLDTVAGRGLVSVLALAVLAVLMAVCSEADAFVAASLPQFSPTARLAFMVVGPVVDLKLVALQAGTYGRGFAARFAPVTFVVAVVSSIVTAWVVL